MESGFCLLSRSITHRYASFEEYCIYEILGITEVGEQLEAQHGIDSYIILGRLGRDGMIAERYTRSKHAPD
ncbi:unnamed protein product [Fusarium graminearum]|nr:unnamed protein product [Fusarium graminearum]